MPAFVAASSKDKVEGDLNFLPETSVTSDMLLAPVRKFKLDDVIFTQIPTRLHFDDFEWNASRVSKAVQFAQGYVVGLAFGEDQHLVAVGDLSVVRYHYPMLRAVMVFLRAQIEPGGLT